MGYSFYILKSIDKNLLGLGHDIKK